jgi:hypothetical protein
MGSTFRRLGRSVLFCAVTAACLLALPPANLNAETSYHKLKKRLRKAERISGTVLGIVGEAAVNALLNVEFDFDDDDDDSSPSAGHAGKPKTPSAPKPVSDKPKSPKPPTAEAAHAAKPAHPGK